MFSNDLSFMLSAYLVNCCLLQQLVYLKIKKQEVKLNSQLCCQLSLLVINYWYRIYIIENKGAKGK